MHLLIFLRDARPHPYPHPHQHTHTHAHTHTQWESIYCFKTERFVIHRGTINKVRNIIYQHRCDISAFANIVISASEKWSGSVSVSLIETGFGGIVNNITMRSIDFKYMNFPVCMVVIISMLSEFKDTSAAYPLEKDISHLTGIDPPKRWLVFMEIRVRQCIKFQPSRHLFAIDLLSFLWCTSFGHQPRTRCTRSSVPNISRWKVKATVFSNKILFLTKTKQRRVYCPIRRQRYRLLVHKLFGFNLTIAEFMALDSNRALPLPGECTKVTAKFIVFCNNNSIVYCVKRYPWSIYSNNNMVIIELVLTDKWESYYITILMMLEVVDPFYSTNPQPAFTVGPSAWGSFKIATYHITVEMIYRVLVSQVLQQTLKFKLYDGPDAKMPRLPVYRKFNNHTLYLSSTFQVFCAFVSKTTNQQFGLHYTTEPPIATHVITANKEVILTNNTGCGNDKVESWMCIFNIVSLQLTNAQVHISTLTITGIFTNVHTSVGVVIYNIINNKTSLVGHWCYGTHPIHDHNFTFTGSGNQLIVSFYAYSPYSLLSCKFYTYASICVGSFMGKHMRPSMLLLPQHIWYEKLTFMTSNRELFNFIFDVTDHCYVIHISILPSEYTLKEPTMRIYFQHKTNIRIIGMLDGGVIVSGIYSGSLNQHRGGSDITGDIKYIHMDVLPIHGNRLVTVFTVSPTDCIQRCSSLIPVLTTEVGRLSSCNICKHTWLDCSSSGTIYEMKPHASTTFERVYGLHSIEIVVTSLTNYHCRTNERIRYYSDRLSLHFLLGNVFFAYVHNGYWRFDKDQVAKVHADQKKGDCRPLPAPTRVRHFRMHMYIVASEFQMRGSSWQQWQAHCAKYGADILTIDDQQELYYFVRNIMLPFAISLTAIGLVNQVWLLKNTTVLNHYCLSRMHSWKYSCIRMHKPEWEKLKVIVF